MSVLFDALGKAAREYRNRQSPVTVVPLVDLSHKTQAGKAVHIGVLIAGIAAIAVLSATATLWAVANRHDLRAALLSYFPEPEVPAMPLSRQQLDKATRSDGIALPFANPAISDAEDERKIEAAIANQIGNAVTGEEIAINSAAVTKPRAKISVEPPPSSKAVSALGKASELLEKKDYIAAIKEYDRLIQGKNNKTTRQMAISGKAYALQLLGTDEAVETLREMATTPSPPADVFASLARVLTARGGATGEAISAWRKAADTDPSGDYMLSLAIALDRIGEHDSALAAYSSAPKPLPEDAKARMEWLQAQHDAGKLAANKPGEAER